MRNIKYFVVKALSPDSSFWDPPFLVFIALISYIAIPKGKLAFIEPNKEARWYYFGVWKEILLSEKRIRGKLCFTYHVLPDALALREEYGEEIRRSRLRNTKNNLTDGHFGTPSDDETSTIRYPDEST